MKNRIVTLGVELEVELEEYVMDTIRHIRNLSGDGNIVVVTLWYSFARCSLWKN